MKRNLFQNVKVQPYKSGDAIKKGRFLSAILGASIGADGTLTVTVTHSDDGTAFVPVTDELVFPEKKTENGKLTTDALKKDDIVDIDVDLVGLKDFVKFEVSGAAATGTTLAITLGDGRVHPV